MDLALTLPVVGKAPSTARASYRLPLTALASLFFMWGFLTCLNDILIPHLKAAFSLSYAEAALVQFCFFAAYFLASMPSGAIVRRLGYQRGIVVGLLIAGLGCLGFYPAAATRSYPLFLGAFFVLASGITLLQVSSNPYVAILGRPETASARLNLTQAFNSLGTFLAPFFGSIVILSVVTRGATELDQMPPAAVAAYKITEASSVQVPYLWLAGALALLALVMGLMRLPDVVGGSPEGQSPTNGASVLSDRGSAWHYPHLVLGALAIFVYVGAEVSIGSFLVSFMKEPEVAGLNEPVAGRYLMVYWGGAMVGRFIGSALLRRVPAGGLLALNALAASTLAALTTVLMGHAAMGTLLAVGLFNSVMFPTIFALAVDGLGRHTEQGSGILCMAIVGGAVIPFAMGLAADHLGIHHAFLLPAVCYLYIAFYGFKGSRHAPPTPA